MTKNSTEQTPVKVFISYAHADEKHCNDLKDHLSVLLYNKDIEIWYDRHLIPGETWDETIREKLQTADLILLLVSVNMLKSRYILEVELEKALQQRAAGTSIVIPIILKPCDWQDTPFSKFQGLPKDAKPISTWSSKDEAYVDVVKGIRSAIKSLIPKLKPIDTKDTTDPKTPNQTNKSTLSALELEGLLEEQKILTEKLSYLRKQKAKLSDGSKKFEIIKDIEEVEKELDILRVKIG